MEPLLETRRQELDRLIRSTPVVLFMKGTRSAPRCGFSARVVQTLDGLLDTYTTHDVLADAALREDMKAYAGWPTFPQLWANGEFIGGADIIHELATSGELEAALGVEPPQRPDVSLSDAARDRIRAVLDGEDAPLRLVIDASFRYRFEPIDEPSPTDILVRANGVQLVFDRPSARRAAGLKMDFVPSSQGGSLVVENPNEPARVQQLSVSQLDAWRRAEVHHQLIDVRTPGEYELARIEGSRLLDDAVLADLEASAKETPLVIICHHGVRSQRAAEQLIGRGFRKVFNLAGGIDAWSTEVDPDVPRYG
jgi:monothiol glutaredoxin